MPQPDNVHTKDEADRRAIAANFVNYTCEIARLVGGEVQVEDHLTWVTTPTRMAYFNGVMRTELTAEHADATITAMHARWRERRFSWWVTPTTTPPDLADHLARQGMPLRWSDTGMAADLATIPDAVDIPADVTIAQVQDAADQMDWARIMAEGFVMPPKIAVETQSIFGQHIPLDHPDIALFLARQRGEPVAVCLLFCDATAAGICEVAVAPHARRQGIGAAVTLAAMHAGRARGKPIATLQASPMGQPVYVRIGFRALCSLNAHVWEPEG